MSACVMENIVRWNGNEQCDVNANTSGSGPHSNTVLLIFVLGDFVIPAVPRWLEIK